MTLHEEMLYNPICNPDGCGNKVTHKFIHFDGKVEYLCQACAEILEYLEEEHGELWDLADGKFIDV